MSERLLKITCEYASKKINAYLKMPSPTFAFLYKDIERYLFEERQLPKSNLRTFWIDTDGDEIDIMNQCDYEVFMTKFSSLGKDMHMRIAPIKNEEPDSAPNESPTAASVNADDPTNFIIHDGVECDECGLSPVVGFRYKCLQCHNFDICQSCEAAHKHAEHMLVRIPDPNCPSVIDAWVTNDHYNGSRRRGAKRNKGHCPFAEAAVAACNGLSAAATATNEAAAAAAAARAAAGTDTEHRHHHGRKHHRRHGRHGFFSNLYEMMNDLAETNIATAPTAADETAKTNKTAPSNGANVPDSPTVNTPETENKATSNQSVPINENAQKAKEPTLNSSSIPTMKPQSAENAQQQKNPEPSTPVPNLESLAQVVPPEYMRAGIEILNNFSQMFAKILDPVDGSGESLPTFTGTLNDLRKNSNVSTSSASSSGNSTYSATTAKQASTVTSNGTEQQVPPAVEKPNQKFTESVNNNATLLTPAPTPTPSPTSATTPTPTTKETRSYSEEGDDWQLIDNQAGSSQDRSEVNLIDMGNVSNSSNDSIESNKNASIDETVVGQSAGIGKAANINFAQLSEDLRRHVAQEAARADTIKNEAQTFNSTETQTAQIPTVSTSTTTTNSAETPLPPEEKRDIPIYHTNQAINNAVHAMMAMGFSNEGAWLTQLLESVNGNIAEALDVMSASQRRNN